MNKIKISFIEWRLALSIVVLFISIYFLWKGQLIIDAVNSTLLVSIDSASLTIPSFFFGVALTLIINDLFKINFKEDLNES